MTLQTRRARLGRPKSAQLRPHGGLPELVAEGGAFRVCATVGATFWTVIALNYGGRGSKMRVVERTGVVVQGEADGVNKPCQHYALGPLGLSAVFATLLEKATLACSFSSHKIALPGAEGLFTTAGIWNHGKHCQRSDSIEAYERPFSGSLFPVFHAISCRIFACAAGADPARDFMPIGLIPYCEPVRFAQDQTFRPYHGTKPHWIYMSAVSLGEGYNAL